jgi:actin-related protein 8
MFISQTQAMIISTQHLFTPRNLAALESAAAQSENHDAPASGQQTPFATAGAAQTGDAPSDAAAPSKSVETSASASDTPIEGEATSKAPTPPPPSSTGGADEAALETAAASPGTGESAGNVPGGFNLDIAFEASKLPMDVAIFNSARAAGGDEKIRKYLQAVLVVGGTALIPGISHALESRCVLCRCHVLGGNQIIDAEANRLQAIATPLVSNMDKVQIIPPPKGVDPRVLVWKGAAVLGKMDGVSDLWLTVAEWVSFRSHQPCIFNRLSLTYTSRTSWGYGDFVNVASTYKHSCIPPGSVVLKQLVHFMKLSRDCH